ncbi:glycosyltransferase involved in cell wall biosynthesis [Mucilaginibacter frigoritolerans]|uniref:Glycosyltransferase involved in cell wall biosynthesis n=2 Tax=Mucilaginibacter frigoritolerans TaxID=652788 RepID=A0A562U088_9SPHI|nr:glycosyltransferase involved in cell wall biosynthesis [Mucilaginibacter frigoritolerans]
MGQDMGGVRQYAVTLLKMLSKDAENTYYVFHESNDPEVMAVLESNPQLKLVKAKPDKEDVWTIYWKKIKRRLLPYYSKVFVTHPEKDPIDKICEKYQIDIIHCPYQYLAQSKTAKSICTMHDVQELHFPQYFTPDDRAYRATYYLKYINNADKIIVSYQHIKNDIIKYFYTAPEKITVCLLDMGNLWFDKYTNDDIEPLDTLGIDYKFVLYPANTWEHKNHQKLMEALLLLKEQGLTDIKLVCSGHQTPYFEAQIKPFIDKYGLNSQVNFVGVVDEKLLYSLYKTCLGVVVPTIYEAGSFPLVESILLDIPVICSGVTSLPETIGDSNFVFDPMDALAISNKLQQLWNDETFRERSMENNKKQAGRLRNTNALNTVKTLYSSINALN